ncbi:hypothetical protein GCM10023187_30430 [Nibrella viscosa]|uniref:histidine kinase n=2 Tax=Nibrella viscosa TaxID=1084524 RepID=A0ABP8KKL3_9BACT
MFTIAAVSDEYLAAFELQRENLLGCSVFEVFFTDGRNDAVARHLRHSLTEVIQTKKVHPMADQSHQWPNAKTGELEWRVWRPVNKPVLNPGGELSAIIHSIEDITNSVQLVEATQANRYLQTIINGFKEPLQVLQPVFENGTIVDFRFKLTNQAYASYANSTPEQLQGKRVGDIFPGYFQTLSFTRPVETYLTGQPLTFEIHYDQDGLDLYNLMSTARLDDEVIIHFTDFTHLRQLQRQLERKIDELNRSNENLSRFAYVASHDLQEPLRKIQQFGDLLRQNYGQNLEQGLNYVQRMQQAAGRMSLLIQDLLTYSRISTSQVNAQPVALANVVSQAIDNLSVAIEESGAQIDVDDLPTVPGDALQLMQLVQNLLSNALKFRRKTHSGEAVIPQVKVRTKRLLRSEMPVPLPAARQAEAYQLIEVSDNGIGFDPRHAELIFGVFQRLHGKQEFSGTGIGLAIVEKVVANHGGVVTATGHPDQGATFSVYLPV